MFFTIVCNYIYSLFSFLNFIINFIHFNNNLFNLFFQFFFNLHVGDLALRLLGSRSLKKLLNMSIFMVWRFALRLLRRWARCSAASAEAELAAATAAAGSGSGKDTAQEDAEVAPVLAP